MKHYSLFDFDGTLTLGDSFTGFIRHVFGLSGLLRVLLLSAPAIVLWKSGFRSNVYAKLRMFFVAFKGMSHDDFKRKGETYVAGINKMLRAEVFDKFRKAVADGDVVAIVSASLGDWIRPWALANGVECVIATEPEVDSSGKLTGRFLTPNCEKEEKVRRVLEKFPQLQYNRKACLVTAYGDSPSDIPLLEFSDTPVWIRH